MGYLRAEEALPKEIIELIQQYVEGVNIYVPRKNERAGWGEKNQTRRRLRERNQSIFEAYLKGQNVSELSERYYLSEKSIWRIVGEEKKNMQAV